jgi:hypothetical protein
MPTLFNNEVEVTRVKNDVNGNPRYAIHFLTVFNPIHESLGKAIESKDNYLIAVNASGCKKYHNNNYGGGLLFQSYNVQDSLDHIQTSVEHYIEAYKARLEKEKINKAIEDCNLNAKLVKAYSFEDLEEMQSISQHGYSSGCAGLIYYSETTAVWKKNKKDIIEALQTEIEGYSEKGFIETLQSFNGLKDYSTDEIGQAVYGRYNSELDCIYNTLVWACGEQLAMRISDYVETELNETA